MQTGKILRYCNMININRYYSAKENNFMNEDRFHKRRQSDTNVIFNLMKVVPKIIFTQQKSQNR